MRQVTGLVLAMVLAGFLPAPSAFAVTYAEVEAAANAEDWATADRAAVALDSTEGSEDFYAAFVTARRLAAEGRCGEAVLLFDMLAMTRPYFTPAHEGAFLCLMAMGDDVAAIARLDAMLAVLPEGAQHDLVFQIRQQVDAEDRPVFNVFGDIAPSSNADRQTRATRLGPFQINDAARGHAGVLFRGGASVTAKLLSAGNFHLSGVARAELGYSTASNLLEPRLTLETPMTFGSLDNTTFLLTPFATAGFSDTQYSHGKAGLRGVVSVQATDAIAVTLMASGAYAAFPLEPYRDGWQYEASLGLATLLNSQTLFSATLGADFDQTLDATRQTMDLSLVMRLDHAMASGLLIGLEGEVGRKFYSSPPPLSTGPNQSDSYASARLELSHRQFTIGPFMPTLYYQYSVQDSDNVFYQYDSHDIGVSMRAKL